MNRLAELRKKSGLSQQQFAKIIGVAQNTVSNWENGNRLMDTEIAAQIANYFNVSLDFLLGRDFKDTESQDDSLSDEDIMFALFEGDKDITPEMYEEVKQFAKFVKERKKHEQP